MVDPEQWSGFIASLLDDLVADDGIDAVGRCLFFVDNVYNSLGYFKRVGPEHRPADKSIFVSCHATECDAWNSLEYYIRTIGTDDPDDLQTHMIIDQIARSVAAKLRQKARM